jgi:hypothetical protein
VVSGTPSLLTFCAAVAICLYGQSAIADTTYDNDEAYFQLAIPQGWIAYDAAKCAADYHRWSFAAANNQGIQGLQVCREWEPQGQGFTLGDLYKAAEKKLERGSVLMEINAFVGGPPPSQVPYTWKQEYLPEARIAAFLRDPTSTYESQELTTFTVEFQKMALSWYVNIYCRKPFPKEDLKTCFAILSSLAFPDIPVRDKAHAVELAIPHIPEQGLPDFDCDNCCGTRLLYEMLVSEEPDGFRVTYTQLDGTQERNPLRAYRYFVNRDAQVTLLESRMGKRFPESLENSQALKRK